MFQVFISPCTVNDWFNLDANIRNSESVSVFISTLLSFIRPVQNNIFNIFDPQGLTLSTRLRLGFSHLNEHRFKRNSGECMNPKCSCSLEIEDTSHYLLHCHHFTIHRFDLTNLVKSICKNSESITDNNKTFFLLYGDSRFDENKNKIMLQSSLTYMYIKTLKERLSGFSSKVHLLLNAVINIFSELS